MSSLHAYIFAFVANVVWQAPLLYFVALLACRIGRRWAPEGQHRIWAYTLMAQALLPAISLFAAASTHQLLQPLLALLGLSSTTTAGSVRVSEGDAHILSSPVWGTAVVSGIAVLWTLATAFFAVRLVYQLRLVQRLRRCSRPATLELASQRRWERLCGIFQQPTAGLRFCSGISGPVTIGTWHKLLLLPVPWLSVGSAELETALAHELAHMQRNDYAWNLCYELLFVLMAWHPCARLARKRVAETREMICDRMAARALHGPEVYAGSLLRLASFCLSGQLVAPPQAIGIFDGNTLERRLMSLSTRTTQTTLKHRLGAAAAGTALLVTASASALAFRIGVPALSARAGQQEASTLRVPSGVIAGMVLSQVPPVYPADARQAHIEGTVVLSAVIGTDGHIQNLTALSGPEELQTPALDAVRQWVYRPYVLNGEPVAVQTTITVNYKLAD